MNESFTVVAYQVDLDFPRPKVDFRWDHICIVALLSVHMRDRYDLDLIVYVSEDDVLEVRHPLQHFHPVGLDRELLISPEKWVVHCDHFDVQLGSSWLKAVAQDTPVECFALVLGRQVMMIAPRRLGDIDPRVDVSVAFRREELY